MFFTEASLVVYLPVKREFFERSYSQTILQLYINDDLMICLNDQVKHEGLGTYDVRTSEHPESGKNENITCS